VLVTSAAFALMKAVARAFNSSAVCMSASESMSQTVSTPGVGNARSQNSWQKHEKFWFHKKLVLIFWGEMLFYIYWVYFTVYFYFHYILLCVF
jgi:hypothetical protein